MNSQPPIDFSCPACKTWFSVDTNQAGKPATCPCGASLQVPLTSPTEHRDPNGEGNTEAAVLEWLAEPTAHTKQGHVRSGQIDEPPLIDTETIELSAREVAAIEQQQVVQKIDWHQSFTRILSIPRLSIPLVIVAFAGRVLKGVLAIVGMVFVLLILNAIFNRGYEAPTEVVAKEVMPKPAPSVPVVNGVPYYFVDEIDQTVTWQKNLLFDQSTVDWIRDTLSGIGWKVESNTRDCLIIDSPVIGTSLRLAPEAMDLQQQTYRYKPAERAEEFWATAELVLDRIGLWQTVHQTCGPVVESDNYFRAGLYGGFEMWNWRDDNDNGLKIHLAHSDNWDFLYVMGISN